MNVPYYKEFVENPTAPRPNEPVNDFEHPTRWARLAYWEKARADRVEKALYDAVSKMKRAAAELLFLVFCSVIITALMMAFVKELLK